jgi:lipopolysaccharide/colanic/teichoic acid biosynthesis glycosyltransferase
MKTMNGNKMYRVGKRISDILSSALALILMLPLLLVITICIKISSPGPVFFMQRRIGLHGKEFRFLKFRTMRIDAIEQNTGAVFFLRNDSRITPIGRFLRKTALDELPSFFSVLIGDMSVIGPRPAFPLEINHYSVEQRKRLSVKPGITGYWQTFGRESGVTDLNKMIEMDLEYIENRSFWLDLKILFKTFWMSLSSKGAY